MVSFFKGLFSGKKPGVGIELASERIHVVELRRKGNDLRLINIATTPVPEDVVQDGQIIDTPTMAELIQSTLADKNIKTKRVATAIPGREAVTRLISVPAELNEEELKDYMNAEAGLYLPFSREEADVDYQKLGMFVDEDGIEKMQVLLVATRKEVNHKWFPPESNTLLPEKYGTGAIQQYGQCNKTQYGKSNHQRQKADENIKKPLGCFLPLGHHLEIYLYQHGSQDVVHLHHPQHHAITVWHYFQMHGFVLDKVYHLRYQMVLFIVHANDYILNPVLADNPGNAFPCSQCLKAIQCSSRIILSGYKPNHEKPFRSFCLLKFMVQTNGIFAIAYHQSSVAPFSVLDFINGPAHQQQP